MGQEYRQLFKPHIINSISGLSLIARVIVDGYLAGRNNSRRVGAGLEFSQYRGYEPGDDMRLLDWKMLARSGRYYIKQAEIDTHITVKFILDSSKSMKHEEDGLSKMDHVRIVVATLGHLAQKQGDAIGLFALNDSTLYALDPSVHKQQYNRFLQELITIESRGKWPVDSESLEKLHQRGQKELVFFVTDMHEHESELLKCLKRLKTKRNEVVLLHIMGTKELEFDYKGQLIFEDLELGTKLKVDTKQAKQRYLAALNAKIDTLRQELLSKNIGYELFKMNDPIAETLKMFLKKRGRLL